jgi:hypothetical protein
MMIHFFIGAWLMYLLGTSGDACLVHDGTLIDGIFLDDSTWLKVHHWYYLSSIYFGT